MSESTYVIRGYRFGYDDECFYVCGGYINSIYHDQKQAEAKYQELEVKYLRNANLSELAQFFDAESEYLQKMDDYVFTKTGSHLVKNGSVESGVSLPSWLSDREVLEFAELGDIHGYQLVAFEDSPIFYAIWNCEEQQFQMEDDEYFTSLVYAPSREAAMKNLQTLMEDQGWQSRKIIGTPEELSSNPILLKQLIQTNSCLSYDASLPAIKLKKAKANDLAALNQLLKNPFFEVRELDPQSIMELEKELGENYEEEYF